MATNLNELIDDLNGNDIPTNVFTIEDEDPMVILGKLNEVISYLETLRDTISSSDTKADEALQKATQAITDATQALNTANGIDAKATQALLNAIEAVTTANNAVQASTQAVISANTALSTANTAINTANSAEETAQSADTKADNAISNANTANATATSAKNTAEGIDAKATTALSNSQTAMATANSAVETAEDALEQVIGGQGTKVYRDTTLLSTLDIKPMEDNISANNQAISTESQARQLADTTLQNNINAETQGRVNDITSLRNTKVDKVSGKGLSTEDFTTTLLNKLMGIASGAEVNVQADWITTNTNDDSFIKNKPLVPTRTSELTNDSGYVTNNAIPTKTSQLTNDSGYITTDTGATSVTVSGSGNVINNASYNPTTRVLSLLKNITVLTDVVNNLTTDREGQVIISNGLLIQWGRSAQVGDNQTISVTFTLKYKRKPCVVTSSEYSADDGAWNGAYYIPLNTISTNGFQIHSRGNKGGGRYVTWFAIGLEE